MPAPYNCWFWRAECQPGKAEATTVARQKAVNLVVLMLSWLHMKRPTRCPPGLSPHTRLSRKQWGIIQRFEAQLKGVELVGMVGPTEMGRTAAKMEGLDSILHDLFVRACSLTKDSYTAHSPDAQPRVSAAESIEPQRRDGCVVVGRMQQGTPMLAKDIETERLSFPKGLPEFNPEKFFDGVHKTVFVDPISLAIPPDQSEGLPPRVQVRASHEQVLQLLHFLDEHHRLRLVPKSKVFTPEELLTSQGRAPRGNLAAGIVIDDAVFAEQIPANQPAESSDGVRRLDTLCEEYVQEGLTAHPRKTFRGHTQAEFWGVAVDGETGMLRTNPKRLLPLLELTTRVAVLGYASVGLLEVGAPGASPHVDILKLSPSLVQELWTLVILGPICVVDLKAQSLDEVFLSDASVEKKASVRAPLSKHLAKEFQRHCLARGTWSRLLSPWQSWLRQHELMNEFEELPEGVPLVSHPLWLVLAQALQFRLHHCKQAMGRRHINLLEMEAVLEVEHKLAQRLCDKRYLLGSDSQVVLAALVKGRSSSPSLNRLLQSSLAVLLGSGLYGNYGYVPSLANVGDDPTRDQPIRLPARSLPPWWDAAEAGDFTLMDEWLASVGYDPLKLAGIPCSGSEKFDVQRAQEELLDPLYDVQKPERMAIFADALSSVSRPEGLVGTVSQALQSSAGVVSENKREQEPESQTTRTEKKPEGKNEPRPYFQAVWVLAILPPRSIFTSSEELPGIRGESPCCHENSRSPLLSERAQQLLRALPVCQFFAPGGRRARPGQNLLDEQVQKSIFDLLEAGAFLGAGAAPGCCSFSRAITPAVRDHQHPFGRAPLSEHMTRKVQQGNGHAAFVLKVILFCLKHQLVYWVENPDGSWLWLLPPWVESGIARAERAYRFDMCRYQTPWRKRTRILTNTRFAGVREICQGGHSHQFLRGRSSLHRCCWTKVAQTYPMSLSRRLAFEMGRAAGLRRDEVGRLDVAACAKSSSPRIGEAQNPGPRRAHRAPALRDPGDLESVVLVGQGTRALQRRIWENFDRWLHDKYSEDTCRQVFLCPSLAVQVLRNYGLHVSQRGGRLYELRHLLVLAQQKFPLLRPSMAPAWQLVSQWEELEPVCHRRPLPEALYKALVSLAIYWDWKRFAGCLILAVEGIARIGEVLRARRADLVLPADLFDDRVASVFLRVQKPKTHRRGKGRVQHVKVEDAQIAKVLQHVFGDLHDSLLLFPLSAASFRTRWEKLLNALEVPSAFRPTPSSVRGGGAILAYKRGEAIPSILWRMRLVSQMTLESYLQELAAESFLAKLPETTKLRIRFAASYYLPALKSLG
ncbi:unnamed protein product [Cladocopium goreaui]|uniref:Tyr recombinase domain-containing protein n=1 Tax=Cladocopium goreaui TaxID=2562237 RepID=A0A9P1DM24_9DINO|nr:unnamed protein product [Cladocopium goreaui]